jgi:hypothetical protein
MRTRDVFAILALGALAGCAGTAQPPATQAPPEAHSPIGSPFGDTAHGMPGLGVPLVLDPTDMRLGTTVQFSRVPDRAELQDLNNELNVVHVILALDRWPAEYANLQELDRLPPDCDLIVILPGYPPSRAAAQAWNMISIPTRIVVLVNQPPPSHLAITDLNEMRGLERVVAMIDPPSRSGFESLQRPVNFRRVMP